MLSGFTALGESLRMSVAAGLDCETAEEICANLEGEITPAAQCVFESQAQSWLSPLWTDFAIAIRAWPSISTMKRCPPPAPLSWKIEATA